MNELIIFLPNYWSC